MIKIKDYIFNENEIVFISQSDIEELHIMLKNNDDFFIKATFEDIEWNYGSQVSSQVKELKHFGKEENQAVKNIIKKISAGLKENYNDYYKDTLKEDEYIELSNKYQRLLNRNEELEEENKQLKELNVCVGCENNPDYKTRINKALVLIKDNAIKSDEWEEINSRTIPVDMRPIGKITYKTLCAKKVKELSEMLKGEE